jgi:hypothetical protein
LRNRINSDHSRTEDLVPTPAAPLLDILSGAIAPVKTSKPGLSFLHGVYRGRSVEIAAQQGTMPKLPLRTWSGPAIMPHNCSNRHSGSRNPERFYKFFIFRFGDALGRID